ncbi:hypothetical protein Rwratislav_39420 [Rhodococcus wratislaviensis IFP 2016]|nr:hypothetical protein Rwratislav_39420 [Rhodococcus wratislaviensis IFP 2016]
MQRLFTFLVVSVSIVALVVAGVGVVGFFVFTESRIDPLTPVDAIVVLGGEHDGREDYGVNLAQQGVARNVVLSNPYWQGDPWMTAFCAINDPRFTVTCVPPVPATTRGEAEFTRELAEKNGWNRVLVISWRFHLPRARYIFSQCFDGEIVMRPVPRDYNYSLAEWEYTYLYQTVGFIKAFVQGSC